MAIRSAPYPLSYVCALTNYLPQFAATIYGGNCYALDQPGNVEVNLQFKIELKSTCDWIEMEN